MNNISQLRYYSSGSYGVLVKDKSDEYIYKITEFTDYNYISANNFNEMLYLNYFKIKYPNLNNKVDNNLPIQNISTGICMLNYFVKLYNVDNYLINKIKSKLLINLTDLIIINKMKFYPYNLQKLNFEDLYLGIEKIILGLHFFHSNGIAHGDLKSINIVNNKNDFKLIDFGGIKFISNPKYDCTCTYTYRSPEDFKFENLITNTKNPNLIYTNNPIKSDIWSLGIVLNEIVNGINPVQIKYNLLRTDNDFMQKNNNIITDVTKYKINKIIEQMLNINPDKRITLNDVYLNLFYQVLPDFEKEKIHFNYIIGTNEYYKKFIDFRNSNYQLIKYCLINLDEEYLYPFIANLFDRFLITLINWNSLSKNTATNGATNGATNSALNTDNKFLKFKFLVDLINYTGDYDNDYKKLLYNTKIIYCAIYIISKLVVLKKNIQYTKEIGKIQGHLNLGWECITQEHIIDICKQIIGIIQVLNYDIVRTKLFMYSNTNKKYIENIIQIIESFDINKIIKYVE